MQVKLRNVKTGVHTAERFQSIHGSEVISRDLKIMDMTAFTLCRESSMPIVVFNFNQPGNLLRLLRGEDVGTLVHWDDSRTVDLATV